jgi:hypothetical protein
MFVVCADMDINIRSSSSGEIHEILISTSRLTIFSGGGGEFTRVISSFAIGVLDKEGDSV